MFFEKTKCLVNIYQNCGLRCKLPKKEKEKTIHIREFFIVHAFVRVGVFWREFILVVLRS